MGIQILIGNMKGNNVITSAHLKKHWNKWHYTGVRCFFNKMAHKKIRKNRRAAKAARVFPRPLDKLRPVVMGQTRKYSSKVMITRLNLFCSHPRKERMLSRKDSSTTPLLTSLR